MAKAPTPAKTKAPAKAPAKTTDADQPGSDLAQDMDHGYHDSAMRTAAGPDVFYPQIGGGPAQLAHDIVAFIRAARTIDGWKSRLFYGKHKIVGGADLDALSRLPVDYNNVPNPQLIHGILGIASEAGEIAEDLLKLLTGGDHIDDNIEREQGDIDWFQELVAEARGVSIPECRFRNILRLRERFPDAFSEEDAVARADEA